MSADESNKPDNVTEEEEEVTEIAGWAPEITLDVLDEKTTGEDEEEELYSQRSKLYRFAKNSDDDLPGEWKERGLGDCKILKHKLSGRIRFLMRQEKTLKIVANHYIIDTEPYCNLIKNAGSDKFWVWIANDFAEGELTVEQFALKFGKVEDAQRFKEVFDNAKITNKDKIGSASSETKNDADESENKKEDDFDEDL